MLLFISVVRKSSKICSFLDKASEKDPKVSKPPRND